MFAIHSPQTVTLHAEGEDAPAVVSFSVDGADTSRCRMEITSKGRRWVAVFNQRGYVVEQVYHPPLKDGTVPAPLQASDYMVDGRDTRSDNPYTHVAPVTSDSAYLPRAAPATPYIRDPGDPIAPVFAPLLTADEQKERDAEAAKLRDDAHKTAAAAAEKTRAERARWAAEKPEERAKREAKEREDRLKAHAAAQGHLPPADQQTFPAGQNHQGVNTAQSLTGGSPGSMQVQPGPGPVDSMGRSQSDPNYNPFGA